MITEIGIVAGEIWHILEQQEVLIPLSRLIEMINKPSEIILMSVGWLAREGHVIVSIENQEYHLKLR